MKAFRRRQVWSTAPVSVDWLGAKPDEVGTLRWYEDDSFVLEPMYGRRRRFDYIDLVRWQVRTNKIFTVHYTIRLIGAVGLLDATIDAVPGEAAQEWIDRLRRIDYLFEDAPFELDAGLAEEPPTDC